MDRNQIQVALEAAKRLSAHDEFVVIGSLSILGKAASPPPEMSVSIDIDFYPRNDPARGELIARTLGEGSEFHINKGYYLDPVMPGLATLPQGWEQRLVEIRLGDVKAYFLDVNDTAISKYARGAENDYRWIEAGLNAGILDLEHAILGRMRFATEFFDDQERARAFRAVRLHQSASREDGQLSRPLLDFFRSITHEIIELDRDTGRYQGLILWSDDRHVVQELDPQRVAIHDGRHFGLKPAAGSRAQIDYTDGAPAIQLIG